VKPALPPLTKQSGVFKLWHVLLIVLVVVGFALFINAKGMSFFTYTLPNSFNFNKGQDYSNYQPDYTDPVASNASYYREPEDTDADIWVIEPNSPQQQQRQQRQTTQAPVSEEYSDNLYSDNSGIPKPIYTYDQQYPPRLSRGYYTVQVFTGYNSKHAYDLRAALKKDGYTLAHIRELRTRKGVLFKVRVGRYKERYTAFAVRDQLRRRYPQTLAKSFVMLVEAEYH